MADRTHDDTMVTAFFFADLLYGMTPANRQEAFERLVSFGVTSVMVETERYEPDVISEAHAVGLQFWGGISCFLASGPEALERNRGLWPVLSNGEHRPQLEWYNGVVPTVESHRKARLGEIERIVGQYEVDGFVLDFIRWPLHWEIELRRGLPPPLDSSFDPVTLRAFRETADLDVPVDDPVMASTWIMENAGAQWVSFKCNTITSFVAAARSVLDETKPERIPLGLCVVPLFPEWVGQRVEDLSTVADVLFPMSYHPALYRPGSWVGENVGDFVADSRSPVVPLIQIDTDGESIGADLGHPVSNDEFARTISDSLESGAAGIGVFTGSELLRGSRGDTLKRALG